MILTLHEEVLGSSFKKTRGPIESGALFSTSFVSFFNDRYQIPRCFFNLGQRYREKGRAWRRQCDNCGPFFYSVSYMVCTELGALSSNVGIPAPEEERGSLATQSYRFRYCFCGEFFNNVVSLNRELQNRLISIFSKAESFFYLIRKQLSCHFGRCPV